jgi:dephospho-CoA kinase
MLQLRQEFGQYVIAEKCVPKIKAQTSQKILIDGLRSLNEADIFKTNFPGFKLFAVHASPEIRFKRLSQRGRSDDPKNYETFHERDIRELSVGLGNAIAMAEHILVNDNSMDSFKTKVKEYLTWAEKKWMKK